MSNLHMKVCVFNSIKNFRFVTVDNRPLFANIGTLQIMNY